MNAPLSKNTAEDEEPNFWMNLQGFLKNAVKFFDDIHKVWNWTALGLVSGLAYEVGQRPEALIFAIVCFSIGLATSVCLISIWLIDGITQKGKDAGALMATISTTGLFLISLFFSVSFLVISVKLAMPIFSG